MPIRPSPPPFAPPRAPRRRLAARAVAWTLVATLAGALLVVPAAAGQDAPGAGRDAPAHAPAATTGAAADAAAGSAVAGVLRARAADPQPRVRAQALARVLGAALSAEDDVLVLRREGEALTLFAGSSDAVLAGPRASETSLSAPAEREGDAWWLPLDAGAPLGLVREDADHVRGPDGRRWRLEVAPPAVAPLSPRAELGRPAPGVRAVRLFAPGPDGRTDALALWVADLRSAALVVPEARAALDAALRAGGDHVALLLVATSLVPDASVEGPTVRADGRVLTASGERLEVLAGDRAAVGPDRPWIAVAWLPPGTRLDLPLTIAWHGASAEVVLRDRRRRVPARSGRRRRHG